MLRNTFWKILFAACWVTTAAQAQPIAMRDVFAAMPDSILPMVTKNNRLDCIDFIENHMEARVRNKADEYVTLEALTADYARFRTSALAVLEMKLLPVSDSTAVLCLVTTIQTGEEGTSRRLEDSQIRFLASDWSPLPTPVPFERLADNPFLRMALSADDLTLTLTPQTALMTIEEREEMKEAPKAVVMRWNEGKFVEATTHE
ncbi:MAG: DUF3256 family protein [Bacteroidaceae bacterium]|nr:DUF3256 family protein [Bacteroidaceae bacterium]MBR1682927.1 DUF3256 family protein [Bacteroidaceae bacterium]